MRLLVWCSSLALVGCFSESGVPAGTSAEAGTSSSDAGSTTCTDATCGMSSATQGTGSTSTSTSTTGPDAESTDTRSESETRSSASLSTTSDPDGSSGMPVDCAMNGCAECVMCSFDTACAVEYAACEADSTKCQETLMCFSDCLANEPNNLQDCVAMCSCAMGQELVDLIECASEVCVGGPCPGLPCSG